MQGSVRCCLRLVWAAWTRWCQRKPRSSSSPWGKCSGSPRSSSSSPSPSGPTCLSGSSLWRPGIISSKSVSHSTSESMAIMLQKDLTFIVEYYPKNPDFPFYNALKTDCSITYCICFVFACLRHFIRAIWYLKSEISKPKRHVFLHLSSKI